MFLNWFLSVISRSTLVDWFFVFVNYMPDVINGDMYLVWTGVLDYNAKLVSSWVSICSKTNLSMETIMFFIYVFEVLFTYAFLSSQLRFWADVPTTTEMEISDNNFSDLTLLPLLIVRDLKMNSVLIDIFFPDCLPLLIVSRLEEKTFIFVGKRWFWILSRSSMAYQCPSSRSCLLSLDVRSR